MFGTGFSASKLKPQLKMAVSRIQIASNKKSALLKQSMREVAVMLSEDPPKEEKAKIRAEALIRDDNMIEAYEILQLECELLYERVKLLEFSKACPPDLVSVVATLMWASQRVDIPELALIRKQFRAKYGKQFEDDAFNNKDGVLNERVVSKLSVQPPAAYLVQTYLEKICAQFEVDWTPKIKLSTNEMVEPMAAPIGYSVQVAQGTGLGNSININIPSPSTVSAMTGHEFNTQKHDDDDDGNGGGGGGNVLNMPIIPMVPAQPLGPTSGGSGGSLNAPHPLPPPLKKEQDFEEVDIFVPGAPSAPPGTGGMASPSSSTITTTTTNTAATATTNNNTTNNNNGGTGGGSSNPSYEDLAARFNQLKK